MDSLMHKNVKCRALTPLFRMPGEWEAHEATWLVWPKNRTTWPGKLLGEVQAIYLRMISALLAGEKVQLLVDDDKTARRVLSNLSRSAKTTNLHFNKVKTVDVWIRDWGPIFVTRKGDASCKLQADLAITKWTFNAWGEKYKDLARDNGVVDKIPALDGIKRFDPGIVLEGGSIDVNGRGVCLTTEQCLLDPRRNPKLSKKDIEGYLRRYLGIEKVIWLKKGIEGDDTDGHVDDISRFVNPATILTAVEKDAGDKNRGVLEENLKILKQSSDSKGRRFRVIELPMPGRVGVGRNDMEHDRLPASYANFYIANQTVLVPIYNHRNDKIALEIICGAFPSRKVIGLECTALVYGLGSIHCVTQQEPAL